MRWRHTGWNVLFPTKHTHLPDVARIPQIIQSLTDILSFYQTSRFKSPPNISRTFSCPIGQTLCTSQRSGNAIYSTIILYLPAPPVPVTKRHPTPYHSPWTPRGPPAKHNARSTLIAPRLDVRKRGYRRSPVTSALMVTHIRIFLL